MSPRGVTCLRQCKDRGCLRVYAGLRPRGPGGHAASARERLPVSHPQRSVLEQLAIFDGLAPEAVREILAAASRREAAPRDAFFQQDDEVRGLYVSAAGRVKLTRVSADGSLIVVHLARPGEPLDFARDGPGPTLHATSAVAVTSSTALLWHAGVIGQLMERHPKLALNVLAALRTRLAEAQERVGELATARAEQRVALALLRFAAAAREAESGRSPVELPISREDVAQMAGTTLYTASRLMSGWERRGVLRLGRQLVVIVEPPALERLASG